MSQTPDLKQLARYAPDSWGQMRKIEIGDVWDEEPAHLYLRERDVVAAWKTLSGEVARLRSLVDAVGEHVCKTALRLQKRVTGQDGEP